MYLWNVQLWHRQKDAADGDGRRELAGEIALEAVRVPELDLVRPLEEGMWLWP